MVVQLAKLLASNCPGSRGETSKRGLDGWMVCEPLELCQEELFSFMNQES